MIGGLRFDLTKSLVGLRGGQNLEHTYIGEERGVDCGDVDGVDVGGRVETLTVEEVNWR